MFHLFHLFRWMGMAVLATIPWWGHAAPMAYKGGVMVMTEFSRDAREMAVNYALTQRDAVGFSRDWQRMDGVTPARIRREGSALTYTRLAQRWNLPDAQANVWLFANAGQVRGNDLQRAVTTAQPGLQLDYETTRVYAALAAHATRAVSASALEKAQVRHDSLALRGGFSFYATEYDETQPWFILQVRREQGFRRETQITPMLRLIDRNYFAEFGIIKVSGGARSAQINFMYTY